MARILLSFFFISILTASFSEETFKMISQQEKKKKEKRTKITEDLEGASAKRNIVLQPAINFGHHSGFTKRSSGFGYGYTYSGLIPGITLNIDGNVHKYVSVGVYYGIAFQKYTVSNVLYLNHVFGARTNFHWWQLLADKTGKDLFANKIDFDIHTHIGGYMAVEKNNNTNTKLKHLGINAGGGIGFKYYFVKYFGVALDAGFEEASWLKLGLALKF